MGTAVRRAGWLRPGRARGSSRATRQGDSRASRAATRSQTASARSSLGPSGTTVLDAVGAEHDRRVVRPPERRPVADLVDDEQVAALARRAWPGRGSSDVAVGVAGLGGEADHDLAGGPGRGDQLGEDVGVAHQRDRVRARRPSFLILVSARRGRPEVGDRGGHHDHVGAGGRARARRRAARRRVADPHDVDAGRVGQRDVGGDQRDLGAAGGRGRRQRVALPAGRAVAEEAHRVERLAGAAGARRRRAGRPGRGAARRGAAQQPGGAAAKISVGLGQPARPGVGAGQPADAPGRGRRRRARAGSRRWPTVAGCSHISVCIAGRQHAPGSGR